VILDYNALRSDVPLPPGSYLQVPRGTAPSSALLTSEVVPSSTGGVPAVPTSQYSHGASGQFPWGQCTYYVSSRRVVTWSGNAGTWFENAREAGRPEGMVPVQGAIVVLGGGWVGHVAYVERVNPDGSFVVSEMNVRGVGVYSERTLTMQGFDLIGFIY
jgi:surface antigen